MIINQHEIPDDWDESRLLFERARDEMDAGHFHEASLLFEESINLEPNYKALLLLGECLFKRGQYLKAVVPLAAATTLNLQGIAPALLADTFFRIGNVSKAKEMIDLAFTRQPQYKRARSLQIEISAAYEKYMERFE